MTYWERHEAVIGALYESIMTPNAMNACMRDVAQLFASVDAVLLIMNTSTGFIEQEFFWTAPEDNGLYEEYYFHLDPRLAVASSLPIGLIWRCEEDFNASYVSRDAFYNEYLMPAGVRYTMGGKLTQVGDRLVYFALHRAPEQVGFSDADSAALQHLYPHLARSARLFIEFEQLRGGWGGPIAETMMGTLDRALIVTDIIGRLHFANAWSEKHLRASNVFSVLNGHLVCPNPGDHNLFTRVLTDVAQGLAGCEVVIGHDTAEPILLRVVPLPCDYPDRISRRILLTLSSLRPKRRPPPNLVSRHCGLTKKEAALACAIADGETLAQYATRNNVTYGTVRSQLHSIFEKTGVSRQLELVAMICGLPCAVDAD